MQRRTIKDSARTGTRSREVVAAAVEAVRTISSAELATSSALKVEWIVSPEQQPMIERALMPALRFVPPWLQSLTVRYDPTEDQNLAAIHVQPEYRHANLRIGSAWFSDTEEERAVALLHEVLHCHIETLAVVFDGLMQATTEEGPLKTWAAEAWRRAEESVVCDLSRVLRSIDAVA